MGEGVVGWLKCILPKFSETLQESYYNMNLIVRLGFQLIHTQLLTLKAPRKNASEK